MAPEPSTPTVPHGALVWRCEPFGRLAVGDLHAALQLRQQVFVMEQDCLFLDIDGADPACAHLCAFAPDGSLQAYLRVVPPGLKYPEASIGRVVTSPAQRGTGLGHELFRRGVEDCLRRHAGYGIRIAAQAHLDGFYGRHGFTPVGERYLEDGIWHQDMVRAA